MIFVFCMCGLGSQAVTAEMVLDVLKTCVRSNVILLKRNPLCLVENVLSLFTQLNWRASFVLQSWMSLFGQNAYQSSLTHLVTWSLTEILLNRTLPCPLFIYNTACSLFLLFEQAFIVILALYLTALMLWVILKVFSADVVNDQLKVFISLTTSLL